MSPRILGDLAGCLDKISPGAKLIGIRQLWVRVYPRETTHKTKALLIQRLDHDCRYAEQAICQNIGQLLEPERLALS